VAFCEVQEMLDRKSSRMAELMSNDPDWREEASQIEEMLDRSDIFVLPEGTTPKAWCQSLFQTPASSHLARRMIDYGIGAGRVRPAVGRDRERPAQ
jgi:hypothetical protein